MTPLLVCLKLNVRHAKQLLTDFCDRAVQSSKMLNEEVNNLVSGLRSNNSLAVFKAMEEKVAALEAEAESSSVVSLHLGVSGWGRNFA